MKATTTLCNQLKTKKNSSQRLYMTKTEAKTPTATDPAVENLLKTAAFLTGAGASDGGIEIDEGGLATTGDLMGAKWTTGEGAAADGVFIGEGA